jgi:uncharacterized protein
MCSITVIKLNLERNETWRYSGKVLQKLDDRIILQAHFNRPDTAFHGILLKNGDRFVETFFERRWYNIFEIHDRDDDHLKGWYCNISYPPQIGEQTVAYVDLALDLLVYPDGRQLILDEDEFEVLPLKISDQDQAKRALKELQILFSKAKLEGGKTPSSSLYD